MGAGVDAEGAAAEESDPLRRLSFAHGASQPAIPFLGLQFLRGRGCRRGLTVAAALVLLAVLLSLQFLF